MRALLTILAAGAAIGLVLFALGVFDEASKPKEPDVPAVGPTPPPDDGPGATLGGERVPTDEPELLIRRFEGPVRAILLSERPTTWSTFLAGAIADSLEVQFAVWYTESYDVQDVNAGPGPGRQRDLKLEKAPTAADIESLKPEILIVDAIDPNAFPGEFWDAVVKRVGSGDMGLWVRPGFPTGAGGTAKTAHPVLSHPALAPLLPVAEADQLEGSPVPGTYPKGVPLVVTDAGARHPATRLTPYPAWAYRLWEKRKDGEFGWRPVFCYPVKKLAAGAESLVDVQVTPIDRRPAIAVSSKDVGRVLWQGNFDFGHRTYYSAEGTAPIGVLVNRMLLWLSGRALQ